jgi:hypothetical protein
MAGVSLMALDDILNLLVRKVDEGAISFTLFSISIPRVTSINRHVYQIPRSVYICTRFEAPVMDTLRVKK